MSEDDVEGLLRPRVWAILGLLALLVACGGSGGDGDSAPDAATAAPPPSDAPDPAAMEALVATSWMRQAAMRPQVVAGLLDAPGGDGWLHLFHGDLDAAQKAFDAALSSGRPEPRLGRARVALDRAAAFLHAETLHILANGQLAAYRRDNPDRVRRGTYELPLSALSLMATGDAQAATAAIKLAVRSSEMAEQDATWGALLVQTQARSQGGDPRGFVAEGLPEPFAARAAFGQHLVGGRFPDVPDLAPGAPDLVDDLGTDPETGVKFAAPWFDPLLLRTLARSELLTARTLAAGLGGPGHLVENAVHLAWGGPLPGGHAAPPTEDGVDLPDWVLLFGSAAMDVTDWRARWSLLGGGNPGEGTLLARTDAVWPAPGLLSVGGSESVDLLLRHQEALDAALAGALTAGAPPEGASLAKDLGFSRRIVDAILRDRMDALVASDQAAQARRLGERALDPNPGERGERAAFTRVSHRNDRAFLVRFATCLWASGQPGLAREYMHPLADDLPELTGPAWVLGQLDAASGIGVRGKISQQ